MPNVFVGSEFGGSATTDSSGNYQINAVPLGDLNSDREWKVTALPDGFASQTKTVIAKAKHRRPRRLRLRNDEPPADRGRAVAVDRSGHGTACNAERRQHRQRSARVLRLTSAPAHGTLDCRRRALRLPSRTRAGAGGTSSFTLRRERRRREADPRNGDDHRRGARERGAHGGRRRDDDRRGRLHGDRRARERLAGSR